MDPENPSAASTITFSLAGSNTSRSWSDFTVEIRRENQSFVRRVPASQGTTLEQGLYFVTARLPSGNDITHTVVVGTTSHPLLFGEIDYRAAVGQPVNVVFQDPTTRSTSAGSRRQDLLSLRTFSKNMLRDALGEDQPKTFGLELLGAQPAGNVATPVAPDVDVAFNSLPGSVTWFQGNLLNPSTLVQRTDLPNTLPFDAEVPIDPPVSGTLISQWRRPQQLALNMVVPACAPSGCRFVVHYVEGQQPRLDVILNSSDADVLVRYLHAGYSAEAVSYFHAQAAQNLLADKTEDPIGALIGAYALLRFAATPGANATDASRWDSWTENLQNLFPQIPDTLVIRAEQLARGNKHREALDRLLRLPERGLPICSSGLSLAIDRLATYYEVGRSQQQSADLVLDENTLARTGNLVARLRAFGAHTIYSMPYLCYSGLNPLVPKDDVSPPTSQTTVGTTVTESRGAASNSTVTSVRNSNSNDVNLTRSDVPQNHNSAAESVMVQLHGAALRGLSATKRSTLSQGFFGRMFRTATPAQFGATEAENKANLAALATAMVSGFDPPKDGRDDEESGIPALFTYFGQFVDHDLTFDPASSLQKQNDPDALIDFRTPAFDLDNIYGRGPDDQPYMYDGDTGKFVLGDPIKNGDPNARDLIRSPVAPNRALIGDPRNDENAIVSQLQGLFHRFHNRMVTDNPGLSFADVQQLVRFHYQYVVVNDFLPRIVHASVLADLKTGNQYDRTKIKWYHYNHEPFMPVEFSVAAYRLGHSMVRPGYRLNDDNATLLPIFPVPLQNLPNGLTGFRALNPNWGIDWGRFIDIDVRAYDVPGDVTKRLQFAYRIDTSAVTPLSMLPPSVASPDVPSLPGRNLLRGWRMGLPSGQTVASIMGVTPLDDAQILIGKFVDSPPAPPDPDALKPITSISKVFAGNCPLWTYILAEARTVQTSVRIPVTEIKSISTPQLGPVGGRIVAETFLGILFGDGHSYLSLAPQWTPSLGPTYGLKDLVRYALGH